MNPLESMVSFVFVDECVFTFFEHLVVFDRLDKPQVFDGTVSTSAFTAPCVCVCVCTPRGFFVIPKLPNGESEVFNPSGVVLLVVICGSLTHCSASVVP